MGQISILSGRPNRWKEFQQRYVQLISEALMLLRKRDRLEEDEPALNRLFYRCIVDANNNLDLDYVPSQQAKNAPHIEDKEKTPREDNIPDFSWPLMDYTASDGNYDRSFTLECKRLGQKTSKNWILTREYVIDGILRFFLEEKGYGKGCETGAMVGYVQDMEFPAILDEINDNITKHCPSIALLAVPMEGWQQQAVSNLNHAFQRPFIPTTFLLQHFWIDMRDCCFLPPPIGAEDVSSEQQTLTSSKKSKSHSTKQKNGKRTSTMNSYQTALPIYQGQENT